MVASKALIDTGAILALLNKHDPWHSACADVLDHIGVPLLTSQAVLTEVFHFMGGNRHNLETAWKFLRSGVIVLGGIEQSELGHLKALMSQYSDHPMDFADATLVYLARRESISTVFTIDHADFLTYRIEGKRRFRVVPERRI
jgi:predicted nucleic acid-binding protein